MSPAEAAALYRRIMDEVGESVTFRRGATDVAVLARVTGYDADEMAAGIDMAARKIIVMHDDLEDAGGIATRPKISPGAGSGWH